jgi:hypothetical protein
VGVCALIPAPFFLNEFEIIPWVVKSQGTSKDAPVPLLFASSDSDNRFPTVDSSEIVVFLILSIASHLSLSALDRDTGFMMVIS